MTEPVSLQLTTVIAPTGPAGSIVLADDQVAAFGQGARPPVIVAIADRSVPARVARMGGQNLIGLSKAARAALGVEIGDEVTATITLDTGTRPVDVPPDLAAALAADPAAQDGFDALARTYRKEFAEWVAAAKKDDTRARRVAQTIELAREGRHR